MVFRHTGLCTPSYPVTQVKKHTLAQLTRQLKETRTHLPGLALYQIHSATEACERATQ